MTAHLSLCVRIFSSSYLEENENKTLYFIANHMFTVFKSLQCLPKPLELNSFSCLSLITSTATLQFA